MYTSKTKLEKYLTVDIDNSFDSQIILWEEAVRRYINNFTGTSFDAPTETRYFDGNGGKELSIDDFVSITTLEILELESDDVEYTLTEGKDNDFITYPYNTESHSVLILTVNSPIGNFPKGRKMVKVTGVWGKKSAVPADIELAATILLSGIVEKGIKGGTVASESLGDYSVSFKDVESLADVMDVKDILQKYKSYRLI